MVSNSFFKGGEDLKKKQLIDELILKISEINKRKGYFFLDKGKLIFLIIFEYSVKIEKLNNFNF